MKSTIESLARAHEINSPIKTSLRIIFAIATLYLASCNAKTNQVQATQTIETVTPTLTHFCETGVLSEPITTSHHILEPLGGRDRTVTLSMLQLLFYNDSLTTTVDVDVAALLKAAKFMCYEPDNLKPIEIIIVDNQEETVRLFEQEESGPFLITAYSISADKLNPGLYAALFLASNGRTDLTEIMSNIPKAEEIGQSLDIVPPLSIVR